MNSISFDSELCSIIERLENRSSIVELLDNNIVLCTNNGFIGYETICRTIKRERQGKDTQVGFVKYNNTENDSMLFMTLYFSFNDLNHTHGKAVLYEGKPLSKSQCYYATFEPNATINYFYNISTENIFGTALKVVRTKKFDFMLPICTISDRITVTAYNDYDFRKSFFDSISCISSLHRINVLFEGQYSHPMNLTKFINDVNKGIGYCSTTITDISINSYYDECFYAIEHINNIFRVFTMRNGFEGYFNIQYFNEYSIRNGKLIFDNGEVKYSFPFYDNNDQEKHNAVQLNDDLKMIDRTMDIIVRRSENPSLNTHLLHPVLLQADKICYNEFVKDIYKCFDVNEEYSENGLFAVSICEIKENILKYNHCIVPADSFYDGLYRSYNIPVVSCRALAPQRKGKYGICGGVVMNNIPSVLLPTKIGDDGSSFVMLSESLWNTVNITQNSYALYENGHVNIYIKAFFDFEKNGDKLFNDYPQYLVK